MTAQTELKRWAVSENIWYESGFDSYVQRVDGEPGEDAVVFIMYSTGPLSRLLDEDLDPGLRQEFDLIALRNGFWWENYDGVAFYFFAAAEDLQKAYDAYFHWQWVFSLIVEDFADLYGELYQYFHRRPERLYNLHHREFEILLYRVFQNQGYDAQVGPGSGDGGVDVKLLQRGPHPQQPGEAERTAYYRQWLSALEELLDELSLTGVDERGAYKEDWRRS